jgi:hypothetical protein
MPLELYIYQNHFTVALFHYPSGTDSVCSFYVILLFLMLLRDHFFPDIYFLEQEAYNGLLF